MDATLVMFKADGQRKEFPLTKPVVTLGRKHTCDLRIPVPSVSREHCRLEMHNGTISLRDLGSSNGTAVNDEPVTEAELNPGDKITIGPVHFVLVVNGEPEEIDPVKTILSPVASVESVEETEESAHALAQAEDDEGISLEEDGDEAAIAIGDDEQESSPAIADTDEEDDGIELDAGEELSIEESGEIPVAEIGEATEDNVEEPVLALDEEPSDDEVVMLDIGEEEPGGTEEISLGEEDAVEETEEPVLALDEADLEEASEEPALALEEGEGEDEAGLSMEDAEEEEPILALEEIEEEVTELKPNQEAEEEDALELSDEDAAGPEFSIVEDEGPGPSEGGADQDDPFADMALETLEEGNDDNADLAELAEAFGEEEDEEK